MNKFEYYYKPHNSAGTLPQTLSLLAVDRLTTSTCVGSDTVTSCYMDKEVSVPGQESSLDLDPINLTPHIIFSLNLYPKGYPSASS